MARKRMLSPEFFTSATVNRLTIPAMVTFAGLWVYADDFGRGEDSTALLKATIWPRRRTISETKVAEHLAELAEIGLVCRYSVGGVELLHLPSWHEHQRISHRAESKLPPCRSHEPGLFEAFALDSGGPLEKFRNPSGVVPERLHDSVVEVSSVQEKLRDRPENWCGHEIPEPSSCAICRRMKLKSVGAQ